MLMNYATNARNTFLSAACGSVLGGFRRHEFLHELQRIEANGPGKGEELDHVQSKLAVFVFPDSGRWLRDTAGDFALR